MGVAAARPPTLVVPRALKWYHRVAASALYYLIRLLSATIRYEWIDRSGHFEKKPRSGVIFCIWHNRLALALEVKRIYLTRRGNAAPLAAMVSASKDGGILARVLEEFGTHPVRGSTSRRGPQALRELTTVARRGFDIALTPDGPRGPRYVVQSGVIALAQVTGLPIVPVSYHLGWKISLRSWDAFQVPLPFSRCRMVLGEPLRVARDIDEATRETIRQQLEQTLHNLTPD